MSFQKLQDKLRSYYNRTNLTKRETEILALWVMNFDYKQISEQLHISTTTVRKHISNIYKKIGIDSKVGILLVLLIDLL
jgi:DNA-binding CsgD family transcriptional regulator